MLPKDLIISVSWLLFCLTGSECLANVTRTFEQTMQEESTGIPEKVSAAALLLLSGPPYKDQQATDAAVKTIKAFETGAVVDTEQCMSLTSKERWVEFVLRFERLGIELGMSTEGGERKPYGAWKTPKWGKMAAGLRYGIIIVKNDSTYAHGKPVTFVVHVWNIGKQEQTVRFPYHHESEFVMTDAKGKELTPQTECCKKHVPRDQYTPQARFVLKPGDKRSYSGDFLRLGGCNLGYSLPPGRYHVRHRLSGNTTFTVEETQP